MPSSGNGAPLRIAYVVNSLSRVGPVLVVYGIVRGLVARGGYDLHVVTLKAEDPRLTMRPAFEALGVKVHALACSQLTLELHTGRVARQVERLLTKEVRPDVVHVHSYSPVLLAAHWAGRWPLVTTLHSIASEDMPLAKGPLVGRYMVWRYHRALRRLDACAAISHCVSEAYVSRGVLPAERTFVIYNGCDTKRFAPPTAAERSVLRERLDLPADKEVVVAVGVLQAVKDPLTVIRAFRASTLSRRAVLVFVGEGPLRAACEREAEGAANVRFAGWQARPEDWLRAADFSVCASRSEGFGLSCVEALLCGLPVVTSDIPAFSEFVRLAPDRLGPLRFRAGDAASLTQALDRLTEAKLDPRSLHETFAAAFSEEKMAADYAALYRKVCGQE